MVSTIVPRFPPVIDSTMLACFDACEMKFFLEYCLCIGPASKSPDLHAGGAFAFGLEAARRSFWRDGKLPKYAVMDGLRAFMQYWGDYEPPGKHIKTFVNTAAALLDYFREYPLEQDILTPLIKTNGEPAIEFTFPVPLPIKHPQSGDPVIYGGRCDMLGKFSEIPCISDEKTTKSIGKNWSNQWKMRGQFIGYCWGAQHYGNKITTAVIRGIAIQVSKCEHIQDIIDYPQYLIDRWVESMLDKIRAMVDCFEKNKFKYSFGEACQSYGGCWAQGICTKENPSDWYDSYPRRVWNPLGKDPLHDVEKSDFNVMSEANINDLKTL